MPAELPPYTARAMRGFETRGATQRGRRRQALTVQHPRALKGKLAVSQLSAWDQRCVWTACTLGFFGGLRSSEYIDTGARHGAKRTDLRVTETSCRLTLNIQKNRQHGPPVHVTLPATGTSTCPVRAMTYFCQARDATLTSDQPLFVLERGAPLTRHRLNEIIRHSSGPGFSSHSLRIGLATTAAAAGVPDDVLQQLGRWTSGAYDGYVRGPRQIAVTALLTVARYRPIPAHSRR